MQFHISPIGHIESPFKEKFGAPRQSGTVQAATGNVVLLESYRREEMWRGLSNFSHVWLLWSFHLVPEEQASTASTVRPPRLGGNERLGVFGSRSPFRPNRMGLSAVKLTAIDIVRGRIAVAGIDLVDGTPIFDIKPYLPYADCLSEATGDLTDARGGTLEELPIDYATEAAEIIDNDSDLRILLEQTLRADPRPAFQHQPDRAYGMTLGKYNVRWSVQADAIHVEAITQS